MRNEPSVDVYSFGALLYYMRTLELPTPTWPRTASSPRDRRSGGCGKTRAAHPRQQDPLDARYRGKLDGIIGACTAYDPRERPNGAIVRRLIAEAHRPARCCAGPSSEESRARAARAQHDGGDAGALRETRLRGRARMRETRLGRSGQAGRRIPIARDRREPERASPGHRAQQANRRQRRCADGRARRADCGRCPVPPSKRTASTATTARRATRGRACACSSAPLRREASKPCSCWRKACCSASEPVKTSSARRPLAQARRRLRASRAEAML